jgi:hypothetical protein
VPFGVAASTPVNASGAEARPEYNRRNRGSRWASPLRLAVVVGERTRPSSIGARLLNGEASQGDLTLQGGLCSPSWWSETGAWSGWTASPDRSARRTLGPWPSAWQRTTFSFARGTLRCFPGQGNASAGSERAVQQESAFSVDEVTVNAAGANTSAFPNSLFVVLQDPAEPPVGFNALSIFADPARTRVSGIFADLALKPTVDVVDDLGNVVNWFSVVATDVFKEQPALSDSAPQRVLFRYLVMFNDVAAFSSSLLPNAGDILNTRLRVTARDRAGNTVQDQLSPRIKLFRDANPYMIDVLNQNPSWLSIDTRVFSVRQTEPKFAHSVSVSGGPNQYIQDVITEFNNGTQNFDAIPADQGQSQLELAPQVSGQNVHNFALARVRVRTTSSVGDVRVFFRLFTTAVSNLSFNTSNYPTGGATPIALLGRTSSAEVTSIPFFAAARVETRDTSPGAAAMDTQLDSPNVQTFGVTPPGGETIRYFGAYFDINSNTERYPQAPTGNGPFPAGQCVSIRNIIRGQHQCMVAEVFYSGDRLNPTRTRPASTIWRSATS